MSDLTVPAKAGKNSTPQVPALRSPGMSGWLRSAVRDYLTPHPDVGVEPVRPVVRREAERAAAELSNTLRPATPKEWAGWLSPMRAVLVNGPPDQPALMRAATAMASVLPEVPACALNPETQREVMRSFKFWPTPSEVWPILQTRIEPFIAELGALRRIVNAPEERERPQPTPEERAAMAEQARRLAAELRASASERDMAGRAPPPKAKPVSQGALLMLYERQIQHASDEIFRTLARARLEKLRAEMGLGQEESEG